VIGVGIALIVLGVVFLFVIPWVGITAGLVGLALTFLGIAGFGQRAVAGDERAGRDRA